MGDIKVLDEQLASQIAAGEVVERPASVVKELIENSLDAGATRIEIIVEGGGLERLVVLDDGKGMSAEDAELCFARHATSKLLSADGLRRIASFGFRGEALAAISSVAKITMTTRKENAEAATRVVVEGGHIVERGSEGAIVGTRFEVRDLFFNVPARRKFLKSERVEVSALLEVVKNAALFAPKVTFRLLVDQKKRFESLGVKGNVPLSDARHLERVVACLGKQIRDVVYAIDVETELIRVVGFVVAPLETRRDFKGIVLSVNLRPVKDKTLIQAVRAAFRTLLQVGRHPMVVLDIQMDLERVDVNVHPQKAEVRFEEPRKISGHLVRVLTDFLATTPWLNQNSVKTYRLGGNRSGLVSTASTADPYSAPAVLSSSTNFTKIKTGETDLLEYKQKKNTFNHVETKEETLPNDDLTEMHRERVREALVRFEGKGRRAPLRGDLERMPVVGSSEQSLSESKSHQIFSKSEATKLPQSIFHGRYFFQQTEHGIRVVDVLSLQKVLLRKRLLKEAADGGVPAQPLLFPAQIQLEPAQVDALEQLAERLSDLGVDVNRFANDRILVRGVPAFIDGGAVEELCHALKDLFKNASKNSSKMASTNELAACISAYPHPDFLLELNTILAKMDDLTDDELAGCTHALSLSSLSRWFKI